LGNISHSRWGKLRQRWRHWQRLATLDSDSRNTADSDPGRCMAREKSWFASFQVQSCWFQDGGNSIRSHPIFCCLEFSRIMSESYAMFSIRADPPTGRDEDIVARKICWKDQMACVQFFGCMQSTPGMLYRKHNEQ
jgi:hypothetical protein